MKEKPHRFISYASREGILEVIRHFNYDVPSKQLVAVTARIITIKRNLVNLDLLITKEGMEEGLPYYQLRAEIVVDIQQFREKLRAVAEILSFHETSPII